MEINSVANQALYLRDQMSNSQLGVVALRESADAQNQVATMLAKNSENVAPPQQTEESGFSTYA